MFGRADKGVVVKLHVRWGFALGVFVFPHRGGIPMTPLRQRLVDDLRLRNYSPRTIEAYVAGVAKFAKHFGRSPDQLGPDELRAFQLHLLAAGTSWSQFNQIVASLRFFFGVTLGRTEAVPFLPYGKRPR